MINLIPTQTIDQLNFQVYEPRVALKPWLQCLWSIDSNATPSFCSGKFYPDGGATLTIRLSETNPLISVILNKQTYEQAIDNQEPIIGLRFNPSGMYTLLGLNLLPYANTFLRLGDDLSPPWYESLCELIESMPLSNLKACVNRIQTWLLHLATHPSAHNSALALARTVQQSNLSVQDLTASLGFTKRTLERRLKNEAGFTPKELINYQRLQQARQQLCRPELSLTEVATLCGYFDQAHFTHTFKRLACETPSEYRKRKLSQNYNL